DWKCLRTIDGHENSVNALSLSPDGRTLASGSTDATIRLWSFPGGKELHVLQDRKKVVSSVRISTDGRWVAAGSYGGRAALWTLAGEPVVAIKASKQNLSSVAVSPDGRSLATAGLGGDIQIWSLPDGKHAGTLTGHETAASNLTYIDGGRRLASLGYEQSIRFWDAESLRELRVVRSAAPGLRGVAFSPDESIAALSCESTVELRSVTDWALRDELAVGTKVVNGMAFSPDGRWLAAGAADRKIRVWRLG
ncbi:MAG: WD40 repeat domain-containing protein, partial [Candidatus Neomarinimicrobiota bacterium]